MPPSEALPPSPVPDARETPDPAWREARHRFRNDLQTLVSLFRLAERRAPADALTGAVPEWLTTLADLYHALPGPAGSRVSLRTLAVTPGGPRVVGDAFVPDAEALAAALGVRALARFCRNAAGPAGDITMEIQEGPSIVVRARFGERADNAPPWPPLDLALAMEALGGTAVLNRAVEETTAALEFPCP